MSELSDDIYYVLYLLSFSQIYMSEIGVEAPPNIVCVKNYITIR
jgi:hypothetical protein